jgi:hypothetical protein
VSSFSSPDAQSLRGGPDLPPPGYPARVSPTWIWMQAWIVIMVLAGAIIAIVKLV